MDTALITRMVTIVVDNLSTVAVNLLHTCSVTMHTDTNLMLHGVLVVTVLEKVTEVHEVVKVWSLSTNTTDKYLKSYCYV